MLLHRSLLARIEGTIKLIFDTPPWPARSGLTGPNRGGGYRAPPHGELASDQTPASGIGLRRFEVSPRDHSAVVAMNRDRTDQNPS
jgi:hypothetical protein